MKNENLLTLNEFREISAMIIVCANRLIDESIKDIPRTKVYPNSYQDEQMLNNLMACYKASVYAKNASRDYIDYVQEQARQKLDKILAFKKNRYERIKILAPFVFYSLIILNEADPIKLKRRMNRFYKAQKDNEKPVNWRQSNPYQQWGFSYRPCAYDAELGKQIMSLSNTAYQNNYYASSFISDAAKSVSQEMHNLVDNLHHMRCIGDMAGAGAFLYDILKLGENEGAPLDTILRMTCVMRFQKVLNLCRLITDENKAIPQDGILYYKDYESKSVVEEYTYEKLGYGLWNSEDSESKYLFPICFKKEHPDGLIDSFFREINKKTFADIYDFLSDNFQFHFPGLLEMYVSKAKLQPYINTYCVFENYLETQNEITKLPPQIFNFTENLLSLSKSIKTIISCQDVLSTQTYISKFMTEKEERQFRVEQEREWIEDHAIPAEDYYIPVGLYLSDDFDENAYYNEKESELQRLKDDLFDLILELNEQKGDHVNENERQKYLRREIDKKVSRLEIAKQVNRHS